MEFETNEAPTDDARILAQTKQVTLQPIDPFLKPEDAPDPIVISETRVTVESESENTADSSQLITPSAGAVPSPVKSVHHHPVFKITVIVLSLATGIVGGIMYFLFLG